MCLLPSCTQKFLKSGILILEVDKMTQNTQRLVSLAPKVKHDALMHVLPVFSDLYSPRPLLLPENKVS